MKQQLKRSRRGPQPEPSSFLSICITVHTTKYGSAALFIRFQSRVAQDYNVFNFL